jgi:hypothetical protein
MRASIVAPVAYQGMPVTPRCDAPPPRFQEIAAGELLRPFDGEIMATQPERQDRVRRRGGFG